VQIAEQQNTDIIVASLVQCCAIKKFLLHHSYTMLLMYSSQQSRLSRNHWCHA